MLGNSNDEANFPHKLLLTNAQVFRLCKAFVLNPSANMKLSKTQFHKTGKAGRFLGRLLGPLLKTGLPLLKYVRKPIAKNNLLKLRLTAAASAIGAAIQKTFFRSGMTTLII